MNNPSDPKLPAKKNKSPAGYDPRRVAALLLGLVVDEGHSLAPLCDSATGNARFRALAAKDRAMVRAILMTALRYRGAILAVMKKVMPSDALVYIMKMPLRLKPVTVEIAMNTPMAAPRLMRVMRADRPPIKKS